MEKKASRRQLLALGGMLAQSVPADLSADIVQRWIDDPDELRAALRKMLILPPGVSIATRTPLLWESLYAACKQEVSRPVRFTERTFPLEAARLDDNEWTVCERRIMEPVTGEEAIALLEADGFRRLDGMKRAMEFIARSSLLQLDHQVVATSSWRNPNDDQENLPVFDNIDGKRAVRLRFLTGRFKAGCGWLVLERVGR
jgi:hypothetical protein